MPKVKPVLGILKIYDASSVIYAGNAVKFKYDTVSENSSSDEMGIAVGGLRYLMYKVLNTLDTNISPVVVFDSYTSRKLVDPEYKGNRTFNPDILIQKEMAYEVFKRIGVPVFKIDGYEADDIIAGIVRTELNNFSRISIVTGDSDLYANIISDKVEIEGSASIYPSITKSFYPYGVISGKMIEYNSILPYYFFFGKKSNNVGSFMKKDVALSEYKRFLNWALKSGLSSDKWSEIDTFISYCLDMLDTGKLTEDLLNTWVSRAELIYPNIPETDLDTQAVMLQDLNKDELNLMCKIFNITKVLQALGISESESIQSFNQKKTNFLLPYRAKKEDCTLHSDFNTTPDMSFFANTTDIFDSINSLDF